MLSARARPSIGKILAGPAAGLHRMGVTPNAITVIGTIGTVASAVVFYPRGMWFTGSALITVFVLFDMLDGSAASINASSERTRAMISTSPVTGMPAKKNASAEPPMSAPAPTTSKAPASGSPSAPSG